MRVLLRPGLGLKRWLALLPLSTALLGLGIGFTMAVPVSPKVLPVLRTLTLGEFTPLVRGTVFILAGVVSGAFAVRRIYLWIVTGSIPNVRTYGYTHGSELTPE